MSQDRDPPSEMLMATSCALANENASEGPPSIAPTAPRSYEPTSGRASAMSRDPKDKTNGKRFEEAIDELFTGRRQDDKEDDESDDEEDE